jgi:hypothetical protein
MRKAYTTVVGKTEKYRLLEVWKDNIKMDVI